MILQEFYFKDENSIGMLKKQDSESNGKDDEGMKKPVMFQNDQSFAMHLTTAQRTQQGE